MGARERDGLLSRALALSLFRLIPEALSNLLKHSQACSVWLDLDFAESLHLSLRDDGCGFEAVATGRGLAGMRQRVESLAGEMRLVSQGGTRIEVTLPQ